MRQRKDMEKPSNVNHDFMYHAEIEYEHEQTYLSLTNAKGEKLKDFLEDIKYALNKYKGRNPKVTLALYDPNNECVNITPKITSLLKINP